MDLPDDRVDAAFEEVFSINVKGNLLGAKAAAPELITGAVINADGGLGIRGLRSVNGGADLIARFPPREPSVM